MFVTPVGLIRAAFEIHGLGMTRFGDWPIAQTPIISHGCSVMSTARMAINLRSRPPVRPSLGDERSS